jgi:glycosyltransferase involved in cell wall biosynthesis
MARIWLVKTGEPLPIDDSGQRLFRMGLLAKTLVERGHDVTWWSSTFNHAQKTHRYKQDETLKLSPNFSLALIHSQGYKRNVSFRRLADHFFASKSFARAIRLEKKPDLVLSSFPTPELCSVSALYCREQNIPFALDIRDLWPDDIYRLVPQKLSALARLALSPMQDSVRRACVGATAILGTSPEFVHWGLKHAQREPGRYERDFPLGYPEPEFSKQEMEDANLFWKQKLSAFDSTDFFVCFFGMLGVNLDLDTIIRAAREFNGKSRRFVFVICGTGDHLSRYRIASSELQNIIFPGWITGAQIASLMRLSKVGLAPYHSIDSFMANLPNKSIEYFSGRLAVVSSLKGKLQQVLEENKCGLTYENGNAEALVHALIRLYDNENELQDLRSNAYDLFDSSFRAEKVYSRMSTHLEAVVLDRALSAPNDLVASLH